MYILFVFYLVFASQIFLLSIYLPAQMVQRVRHILLTYPPHEYGKLYPAPFDYYASREGEARLRNWQILNFFIAILGVGVLVAIAANGYRPDPLGGDEIFVLAFAALQFLPLFLAELIAFKWTRRMRQEYASAPKLAELAPRKLFDVVSPLALLLALGMYLLMASWFLRFHLAEAERTSSLITITGIGLMNLFYFLVLVMRVYGRKADPHLAHQDQLNELRLMARVLVISSVAGSGFVLLSNLADRYAWEVFDPVLVSIFVQFCAMFSIGMIFREKQIADLDFEVYREASGPVI